LQPEFAGDRLVGRGTADLYDHNGRATISFKTDFSSTLAQFKKRIMTNYVLLYTGGFMPESEEDQAAVMTAWGAWYERLGAAIVDGGNPFSASKNVTEKGIGDGPVSTPAITGYTIISADSLDAAVQQAQDHPHVKYGGQVTVYETFRM
jgi:hypothetical protein